MYSVYVTEYRLASYLPVYVYLYTSYMYAAIIYSMH